jgi:hypothetical protein
MNSCAAFEQGHADVLLSHRAGADDIESVPGRLGGEQVLVIIADQRRVTVSGGEVPAPEFLTLRHVWTHSMERNDGRMNRRIAKAQL